MDRIKISVIVPVYNAQETIKNCLNSLINQTFKDFEIICIDDGSTDDSLKILNEYSKNDSRIVVLSQKNLKVSSARNKGLSVAKADYIQFLDSDDTLDKNAFEQVYNKAILTNADITLFGHRRIVDGIVEYDNLDKIERYLKDNKKISSIIPFTHYVWDKLFKKSFLLKNNILFSNEILVSEDGYFMLNCLANKPKITVVNEILHSYIDNESSSTSLLNWTGHSVDTFYHILKSSLFKNADIFLKRLIINKYLNSLKYWFRCQKQQGQYFKDNYKKLCELFLYLEKNIDKKLFEPANLLDYVKKEVEKTYQNNCDCMVVNLWFAVNYGAILTCYGVKCLLEKLGYKTKVVNFIDPAKRNWFKDSFAVNFSKKYLNLTTFCETYEQLHKLNDYCNTFVAGSDQIWSCKISKSHSFGLSPFYYFLNFPKANAKRISYAASFGHVGFEGVEQSHLNNMKFFLKHFDNISVREETACKMLKDNFNVNSEQLIDGAFHIPKEKLEEFTKEYDDEFKKDYILAFCLPYYEKLDKYENDLNEISKKINIPIKKLYFDKKIPVQKWLSYIKNAKFVISDSFHAIVFSIIFNVPFVQISNAQNTQSRFEGLFKTLEIKNFSTDDLSKIDLNEIIQSFDWNLINLKLESEILRAQEWLANAMKKEKNAKITKNDIIYFRDYARNIIFEQYLPEFKTAIICNKRDFSFYLNLSKLMISYLYLCLKYTFSKGATKKITNTEKIKIEIKIKTLFEMLEVYKKRLGKNDIKWHKI